MSLSFTVPSDPSSDSLGTWRKMIGAAAQIEIEHTDWKYVYPPKSCRMTLDFRFKRPKGIGDRDVDMIKVTDVGRLLTAALEGMEKIVYDNERQVIQANIVKSYAAPGEPACLRITVTAGA